MNNFLLSSLARPVKISPREQSSTSTSKSRRIPLLLVVLGLLLVGAGALWSALLSSPPIRSSAQASISSQVPISSQAVSTPAQPGVTTPTRPSVHATPGQGAPTTQPTHPPASGGPAGSTSAPRATPTSAPTAVPTPTATPAPRPTQAPAPTQAPPAQTCLSGSPGTITITQVVGAKLSLSSTTVTLTNCGSTPGHWVASSQLNNGSGWTSCSPTSGDLPAHSSQTVHIAIGSPNVLLGTYTGQWVFSMGNASWTTKITLIVVA